MSWDTGVESRSLDSCPLLFYGDVVSLRSSCSGGLGPELSLGWAVEGDKPPTIRLEHVLCIRLINRRFIPPQMSWVQAILL
jgi:hypothetical protein